MRAKGGCPLSNPERILSAYVKPSWLQPGDEASRYKAARGVIQGATNLENLPAPLLVQTLEKLKTKALGAKDLVDKLDAAFCLKFKNRPATELDREEMHAAVTFFKTHSNDLKTLSQLTGIGSLKVAYLLTHPAALKSAGEILNRSDVDAITNEEIEALLDRLPPLTEEIIPLLSKAVANGINISNYLHSTAFAHVEINRVEALVKEINSKEGIILTALNEKAANAFREQIKSKRHPISLSDAEMMALDESQAKDVIKALAHQKDGLKMILHLYKVANEGVRDKFPNILTSELVASVNAKRAPNNLAKALREILKAEFEQKLIPLLDEVTHDNIYSYLPFFLYGAERWYDLGDPYVSFMEGMELNEYTPQISHCLEAIHYLYKENRLYHPNRMIKAVFGQINNSKVTDRVRADWMLTGVETGQWQFPEDPTDKLRSLFYIFNNASHPEKAIQIHLDSIDDLSRYLNSVKGNLSTISPQFAGALVTEITKNQLPLSGGIVQLLIRAKELQMTPQIHAYFRRAYPRLLNHEIKEKINRFEHYQLVPRGEKISVTAPTNRHVLRLLDLPDLMEDRWVVDLIPHEELKNLNESDLLPLIALIVKRLNAEQQLEALFKIIPKRDDLILAAIDEQIKKIASPSLDLYLSPYEQKHLSPLQIAHILDKLAPHKKGLAAATTLIRNRDLKREEVAELAKLLHDPRSLDFAKRATLELFYYWRNKIDHNLLHPQIKEGIIAEMIRRGREDKVVNDVLLTKQKITDFKCPIEAKIAHLIANTHFGLGKVLKKEEIKALDHYQRLALVRAFIEDEVTLTLIFQIGFPWEDERLKALLECYRDLDERGRGLLSIFVQKMPGEKPEWQKEWGALW